MPIPPPSPPPIHIPIPVPHLRSLLVPRASPKLSHIQPSHCPLTLARVALPPFPHATEQPFPPPGAATHLPLSHPPVLFLFSSFSSSLPRAFSLFLTSFPSLLLLFLQSTPFHIIAASSILFHSSESCPLYDKLANQLLYRLCLHVRESRARKKRSLLLFRVTRVRKKRSKYTPYA